MTHMMIHMKCQVLFSLKNNNKKKKNVLATILRSSLRVKFHKQQLQ